MFSLYGLEAKSVINTGVFINDPFCLKCKIKSDFKIEKKNQITLARVIRYIYTGMTEYGLY